MLIGKRIIVDFFFYNIMLIIFLGLFWFGKLGSSFCYVLRSLMVFDLMRGRV